MESVWNRDRSALNPNERFKVREVQCYNAKYKYAPTYMTEESGEFIK